MTTVRQLSLKVSNVNKNLYVVVKLVYSKTELKHTVAFGKTSIYTIRIENHTLFPL